MLTGLLTGAHCQTCFFSPPFISGNPITTTREGISFLSESALFLQFSHLYYAVN